MRGIFFDEDSARQVALMLVRGGYTADVVRERLSGEDDDEDHPWAVVTDAPEVQLDLLVDTYDGWLDHEESEPADGPALPPLPDAPKRIKRP